MEATEGSPEFVRTTGLLEEDVVPKTLISSSPSPKGIRTWKSHVVYDDIQDASIARSMLLRKRIAEHTVG
jgi:hypothetical protein